MAADGMTRLRAALNLEFLGRACDVTREVIATEKRDGPAPRRHRNEVEFLPAALEVMETPISPAGRALAWTLMGLFSIAIGWSVIGKVDVVASAQGKIIPTGRTKVVQPLEVVRAIDVEDGQRVTAGQPLIELDSTQTAAAQSSRRQRQQAEAEFLRDGLNQKDEADKKIAELSDELRKAHQRSGLQTLTAPIDGVVQQLDVHTMPTLERPWTGVLGHLENAASALHGVDPGLRFQSACGPQIVWDLLLTSVTATLDSVWREACESQTCTHVAAQHGL